MQHVLLTPRTCLSLVGEAKQIGLPGLFKAATAMARGCFPLCAFRDVHNLATTSESLLQHLLLRAKPQASALCAETAAVGACTGPTCCADAERWVQRPYALDSFQVLRDWIAADPQRTPSFLSLFCTSLTAV